MQIFKNRKAIDVESIIRSCIAKDAVKILKENHESLVIVIEIVFSVIEKSRNIDCAALI